LAKEAALIKEGGIAEHVIAKGAERFANNPIMLESFEKFRRA